MRELEVCLVSYGSDESLLAAVRSVRATIPDASIAVVEHGDAVPDELFGPLAEIGGAEFRIEHDPSNPGFAAGCNRLAAGSSADWLLFLNPDAVVVQWPTGDVLEMDTIYGPHHPTRRATAEHSGTTFTIWDEIQRSWLRRRPDPPTGTGFVSGAALLVERATHERLGGFDDRYFMYYEDIDFCLRANDRGVATQLLDGWLVEHAGAHAAARDVAASLQRSYTSGCRFHDERGESLASYRAYVTVDSVLRASFHLLGGRRTTPSGYWRLARRSFLDLTRRRPVDGTDPEV